MKRLLLVLVTGASLVGAGLLAAIQPGTAQAIDSPQPVIRIAVANLDTQGIVRNHEAIPAGTTIQVMVTTNGVDCAGQFAVTAMGAPGAPPAVLVQAVPFLLGPAVGSDSVQGSPLDAGVLPTGQNDFKISATCNGAERHHFAQATFEFFVETT